MFAAYGQNQSFDQLVQDGTPIYVQNNTEPRGLLLCTVTDPSSGRPHKLEFPRTWIPLCLTDMLPRDALSRSIEIRRFLQRGLLRLVEGDEARKILESPEGQKEYARLMQSEFTSGAKMTDRKRSLIDSQKRSGQDVALSGADNSKEEAAPQLQLHPKVKSWEDRVSIGNLDGPSMMSEIRIHDGEFTQQDVQYFLTASFPREVKDWASKKMESGELREETLAKSTKEEKAGDGYEGDWE